MATEKLPKLNWDWGTAYDLFISLNVLHEPHRFGLRGSWAAGVRSRLGAEAREVLEDANTLVKIPILWTYQLPDPKDSATALWTLGQISPKERLPALTITPETSTQMEEVLREVAERGSWNKKDQEELRDCYQEKGPGPKPKVLAMILDWWSHPKEFGGKYLAALQSYYQVFFAEEEARILPVLQESLEQGKALAEKLNMPDLVENLSQGLRFASLPELSELILAPSYWSTPLVVFINMGKDRMLLVYGARPAQSSLVPGEFVPDSLVRSLKALADPTRLKILYYLAQKPDTPAHLSKRLRLRAPTVIHHLNALRLAGLVYLTVEADEERRYAVRTEMVSVTCKNLQEFLGEDKSS